MDHIGVTFEPLPAGSHNVIVRCGRDLVCHYDDFEFSFVLSIDGESAIIKGAAKVVGVDERIRKSHQRQIMTRIAEEFPQIVTLYWERTCKNRIRTVSSNLDEYRR